MDKIEKMLSNQIQMKEFIDEVFADLSLQNEVNNLVPESAKYNPDHKVWRSISYDALRCVNFVLWNLILERASFNNTLSDNLNIFGIIEAFYCFSHPGFQVTSKYVDEFGLLLDVAGDCFGGPEVNMCINSIISECVSIKPKTLRIREAKEKLALAFHIQNKKRPYWINGAEWPMGTLSPMQFMESKKIKDGKVFRFYDVDNGAIREIVQYY